MKQTFVQKDKPKGEPAMAQQAHAGRRHRSLPGAALQMQHTALPGHSLVLRDDNNTYSLIAVSQSVPLPVSFLAEMHL